MAELKEKLFPMLEQCEREGKRIVLRYDAALQDAGVLDCPFDIVIAWSPLYSLPFPYIIPAGTFWKPYSRQTHFQNSAQ